MVRASRPLALVTTAAVLAAFALGGCARVGRATKEPRPVAADPRPASDPGRAQAEKAGIDVDAVVDRVRHRVTAEGGSRALAADDEHYRARFDATGFGFTLGDRSSRFGVSLRGVQRGEDSLALVPDAWTGEANVAVRDLGAGMTERVTARAGELEWDVALDRPLPGTGDVRIEAELHGLDGSPARIADGSTWRFPVGEGQTARMGEVVVKDATGAELHRALPQVRGDTLRLVVPASVLAGARYPLTIDPTVGPELHVGGDPVYGQAPSLQHNPAVAWNGTNFLVVWESGNDISGARVSATGNVLDPTGISISTAANNQTKPVVAWNGTNFLVVWQDQRSGAVFDTYGTRVSSAGSVLDPAGIPISTAAGDQRAPALASDGTDFLVVWHVFLSGANNDLYGARVSGTGSVLDPAGIPISTAATSEGVPAVAWNGTNFLVVWEDQRSGACCDIYGARMNSAGSVLDPAGIPITTATDRQRAPAVASNGTNFLVVWDDRRSGPATDIYGARVSGTGTVLDPAGIAISTAVNSQAAPAVAFNGTDFLVVWDDYRTDPTCCGLDVYGSRVSSAGSVLDPVGILISADRRAQNAPAVASDGTDFFAVWQDWRFSACCQILGARVNAAGSVVEPDGILLSTAANSQIAPVVAWNGTDFLVVWEDNRSGLGFDIFASRVSGNGTVLDPSGIFVASTSHYPAVAWDGTNFLVVWVGGGIRGTRISAAGGVLEPGGFLIGFASGGVGHPALAWSGSEFLVVWERFSLDDEGEFIQSDIYGSRVSSAGSVLDLSGIPVSTAANDQFTPAVAWNGRNYLVVWSDDRGGASGIYDIYGTRVSGGGSVLDPAGLPVSTAANSQTAPAVASWADHFLVVWQDRRAGTNSDIYGTEVSAGGTVGQPAGSPISTAAGDQESPDLAVRYHFLVAWRDRRSGTNYDVYATRVSPSGVVEEPSGVVVSAGATDESAPAVTGGPGLTWEVAYDRFVPESPYNASRVFMRSVSPK